MFFWLRPGVTEESETATVRDPSRTMSAVELTISRFARIGGDFLVAGKVKRARRLKPASFENFCLGALLLDHEREQRPSRTLMQLGSAKPWVRPSYHDDASLCQEKESESDRQLELSRSD